MTCPFCGDNTLDAPCRNIDQATGCTFYRHAQVHRGGLDGFGTRRTLHPSIGRHLPRGHRIYFAHPMPDYNTVREKYAMDAITRHFGPEFHVVNPNHPDHEAGYTAAGRDFSYWTDLAKSCGRVVFMSLPLGIIGSGVWKEVDASLREDREVWQIDRADYSLERVLHLDPTLCASVEETRRWTKVLIAFGEGS